MDKRNNIFKPIIKFIKHEINAGIVLLITTLAALIVANSPAADIYFKIFEETHITFEFEFWKLSKPVYYWINDGLMGIFFFLIGLELKREIKIGELSSIKKAVLPGVAAIGGMLVPAIIFIGFNHSDTVYINGWAIPMATDIAFALGILAILGKRVPVELKIFIVSLAVVDDLGAVLTIAAFYTEEISFFYLGISIAVWLVLFALNKVGVRSLWIYIVIGIFGVWYPLLKSGVHATVAGVLVAFTIPLTRKYKTERFVQDINQKLIQFKKYCRKDNTLLSQEQYDSVDDIKEYCSQVSSPLQNLEHALHNVTFYFIMPLFAFANTGIRFEDFDFNLFISNTLPLGIFFGLIVGKALGISLFVFIFHKLRFVILPKGINYRMVIGAGFLAGIGFTMSIFIADLAFHNNEMIIISKVSILAASLIAGLIGYFILRNNKKSNESL
ncbi:MAG: Na+/H+ antiporter NhaA [Bacteroidota bacterium]